MDNKNLQITNHDFLIYRDSNKEEINEARMIENGSDK